jgi:hypothetical protein
MRTHARMRAHTHTHTYTHIYRQIEEKDRDCHASHLAGIQDGAVACATADIAIHRFLHFCRSGGPSCICRLVQGRMAGHYHSGSAEATLAAMKSHQPLCTRTQCSQRGLFSTSTSWGTRKGDRKETEGQRWGGGLRGRTPPFRECRNRTYCHQIPPTALHPN